MSKTFSRFLIALLGILNILFMFYWITLSVNYCLHYDDVHFMWKMREYSIFEYVREMYMTRGGNFIGYGLNGVIFTISNLVGDYHVWPILFYSIGIAMSYGAVKGLIPNVSDWKVLIGIMSLYNVYILTVPDYAVFTWLCAMAYFLYGPAMCLLIRYLNEKDLPAWKWCVIVILALFLSGSNVSITPMVWVLMLVNALWIWKNNNWNIPATWSNITIRRIVYLTIGMLIIYAIMFVAPGNFSRLAGGDGLEQPANLMEMLIAWVKCIVIFLYFMAFYLPYHLLAVGLGYITGWKSKLQIHYNKKVALLIILAYLAYLGIAVLPLAYLSNGFQIQRNYTHITFFYIIMWLALGFVLGTQKAKPTMGNVITSLCTVLLIIIMSINIYIDIPLTIEYKKAHKARVARLLELKTQDNKSTVEVDKYPSTATLDAKYVLLNVIGKSTSHQSIYYESDTDTVPNEYESHVRHLYNLDFDFVIARNND